jgi:hypothetical protein
MMALLGVVVASLMKEGVVVQLREQNALDDKSIPQWASRECQIDKVLIKRQARQPVGFGRVPVPSKSGTDKPIVLLGRLQTPVEQLEDDRTYRATIYNTTTTIEAQGKDLRPNACFKPYANCQKCWRDFAESSDRFGARFTDDDAQLQMALAKFYREHDPRHPTGYDCCPNPEELLDYFTDELSKDEGWAKDKHFGQCFACTHTVAPTVDAGTATDLGVLGSGVHSFMDRQFIQSVSANAERVQMRPFDDQLVMSNNSNYDQHSPDSAKDSIPEWGRAVEGCGSGPGFPGSVIHNGTHFSMFYHASESTLARATSTDGIHWGDKRKIEGVGKAEPEEGKEDGFVKPPITPVSVNSVAISARGCFLVLGQQLVL